MSEVKHTPGPWHAGEYEEYDQAVIGPAGIMVADCSIYHETRSIETNQANARLIAAAPEMYAALKALLKECSDNYRSGRAIVPSVMADACDAISKAEGRE